MRPALRLLPLPLCIAFSLNARAADDMPPNWRLCPVQDVVKPFAEAQAAPEGLGIDNTQQATDIEGDALSGTEENPVFNGNVTLRRGNQFLGADQLTYDKGQEHYTAEGSIRYQGSGLRMTAASALGSPPSIIRAFRVSISSSVTGGFRFASNARSMNLKSPVFSRPSAMSLGLSSAMA